MFRDHSGRILASLIRRVGDFDLAGDAVQDAFAEALEHWPAEGLPRNPAGWIAAVARRKAIDRLRRSRGRGPSVVVDDQADPVDLLHEVEQDMDSAVVDDRLRLIFTCCHPALNQPAQVALTLHCLAGLSIDQLARAFVVQDTAMAQRLVRAKRKIREAGIPYRVPPDHLLPERLPTVLAVVYLVFSEGFAASSGDHHIRSELCEEALRLGQVLGRLMPDEPEVLGLMALMQLQHARRDARTSADGDIVLLEDQDRTRWNTGEIAAGRASLQQARRMMRPGNYQLQAAIAAVHASASRPEDTDWRFIVGLYDELQAHNPSPVVALNRAVAVAMAEGPAAGLAQVDTLAESLDQYRFLHATRAELLRRLGRVEAARAAYDRAISMTDATPERRFLERQRAALDLERSDPT